MRSRLIAGSLFVAVVALAGSGCGSDNSVGGGKLRIGVLNAPANLNGARTGDQTTVQVITQVFEGLYAPGANGPEPNLATSSRLSPDKTTWTFALRRGVTFSNGKPLTSADVKFSLIQAKHSPNWGDLNSVISQIRTPDPHTVQITTTEPSASLPAVLSLFADFIVPNNYGGESAEAFYQHPIGTGPFEVAAFSPSEFVKLRANPHYWKEGLPKLDEVTFVAIPNDSSRINQLKAGTINAVAQPPLNTLDTLGQQPGVEIKAAGLADSYYLEMDTRQPPFNDLRVREAISLLINRKAIADALLPGVGDASKSWLPASTPLVDFGEVPPLRTDPERAKTLLAKTDVPNGFTTTLNIEGGISYSVQAAQIIQRQLADAGIEVQIQTLETGAFYDTLFSRPYKMAFTDVIGDIPDPDELVSIYSTLDDIGSHLHDSELRRLAARGRGTFDRKQRERIYGEWTKRQAADYAAIPITQHAYAWALSDTVQNFVIIPFSGTPLLATTTAGG